MSSLLHLLPQASSKWLWTGGWCRMIIVGWVRAWRTTKRPPTAFDCCWRGGPWATRSVRWRWWQLGILEIPDHQIWFWDAEWLSERSRECVVLHSVVINTFVHVSVLFTPICLFVILPTSFLYSMTFSIMASLPNSGPCFILSSPTSWVAEFKR